MTSIVSVANEKGGVAKTTTALSLGGALVEFGYRVLMIDLDPQANLSLSLDCEPGSQSKSFINVVMENLTLEETIKPTPVSNLFILPANKEIGYSERVLPSRSGYESLLKNLLAGINGQYDFVVIDCPPFLGALTANALTASDLLIIPTQAEYYSVFALRNMMSMVRHVRASGNTGLRYRLLITLFDKRNGIHRTLIAHLRQTFNNGVLDSVIEVDTKLRESAISGLPINFHASKSRAAMQYRFLAQEIIRYVKQ
jgi:chromosome partitioning protein